MIVSLEVRQALQAVIHVRGDAFIASEMGVSPIVLNKIVTGEEVDDEIGKEATKWCNDRLRE